jgi:hypothetical protein
MTKLVTRIIFAVAAMATSTLQSTTIPEKPTKGSRGVIIPVYDMHFPPLVRFFKSVVTNVPDATTIPFMVVTSDTNENKHLETSLVPALDAHKIRLVVRPFQHILKHFRIEGDVLDRLRKQNKFLYQTVKKLYAMRYFSMDQMLWADAEMLVLRETSFQKVFDDFFKNPFVFYTRVHLGDDGNQVVSSFGPSFIDVVPPMQDVLLNSRLPFGVHWQRYIQVMGYQGWFTEATVIHDFFKYIENKYHQTLIEKLCTIDEHQFEPVLLFNYLHQHQRQYPQYKLVAFEDVLPFYLGERARDYMNPHYYPVFPQGMECMINHVTDTTLHGFSNFMNDYSLAFFRFDGILKYAREGILPRLMDLVPTLSIQVCSEEAYLNPGGKFALLPHYAVSKESITEYFGEGNPADLEPAAGGNFKPWEETEAEAVAEGVTAGDTPAGHGGLRGTTSPATAQDTTAAALQRDVALLDAYITRLKEAVAEGSAEGEDVAELQADLRKAKRKQLSLFKAAISLER